MDLPPNVHLLRPENASELEEAIAKLRRDMAKIAEFNELYGKVVHSEYVGFVKAGFSPAQAMQLVKAKLTPPAK